MKNGLYKFAKGMFAIFTIKLLLFSIVFIVQSCQQSEIYQNQEETLFKNNFLKSTNIAIDNLNKVKLTPSKSSLSKLYSSKSLNEEIATISIYSTPENPLINQDVTGVSSLQELSNISRIDIGVSYANGSSSNNISESQVQIASYQISVDDAKEALQVTLDEAKSYLRHKGFTDFDISTLLEADLDGPAMSESDLIPTVLLCIANEQESKNQLSYIDFMKSISSPAYASKIGSCAGDALGISAVAEVMRRGIGTTAGKKLLKKAIRKVAARALGWVGAAIFVYEFGDCMGWWNVSGIGPSNLSCVGDLLTVQLKNSDELHLIAKQSINYVDSNLYYIKPNHPIKTYRIDFYGEITIDGIDEKDLHKCYVRENSVILPNQIDINSIKEYHLNTF